MSKDKISDYDATAANNTDVGGIAITGASPPSNFDNALRELASHLADMNAGTSPIADTFTLADPADLTKKFRFDGVSITTGTTRVITIPDEDITLSAAENVALMDAEDDGSKNTALNIPSGTTAQRPTTPDGIQIRYNTTDSGWEGYDGSVWGVIGGGGGLFKGDNGEIGTAAGDIFRINNQTLTVSTTIDADENASATGPLVVDTGVTLTVTSGGNLAVI